MVYIVRRRSEPPFYRQSPPYMAIRPFYIFSNPPFIWPPPPPFLYFFLPLPFWQDFSNNITSLKYQINTKIKSCGKVISSFLENQKTMLHAFFTNNTFISNTGSGLSKNSNNPKYQKESREK